MSESPPDASPSIFRAQINALETSLNCSLRTLDALRESDPRLHDAARRCFQQLVDARISELNELRRRVAGQPPDADLWCDLAAARRGCNELFADCLTVIGSALMRRAGLDQGICRIADALLAELATSEIGWPRFTVLAPSPTFTRRTDIISLRFPEFNLWALPVVAHELGHYVVKREGGSRFPYLFTDILEDERRRAQGDLAAQGAREQQDRLRLEELFCDLFAIYTLGPAYACSTIIFEFAPHTADSEPESHPADNFRVAWMLRALEQLDCCHQYPAAIGYLSSFWDVCTRSAGVHVQHPVPAGGTGRDPRVDRWLAKMLSVIKDTYSFAAFKGWPAALSVAAALQADGSPEAIITRVKSGGNPSISIGEVLNGAWWWRLSQGDLADTDDFARSRRPVDTVGANALAVCRSLVERSGR